jgi:Ca-activated chloride channel family protein
MTVSFQFAHPWFLLLLLLLPVMAWWKGRRGQPLALRLPSIDDAVKVGARSHSRAGAWLFLLSLLSVALLVVALARPRRVRGTSDVESQGIDIILTIDVSGSMEALDFKLQGKQANRLEVVKDVVAKFVVQRPDDRIGMVAFAGRPYLAAPLTNDEDWIAKRLQDVKIGQVEDGTAIGSAIVSSVDHLRDSEAKSKIVILLTDGVNTSGSINPLTATEAAKALGIKIYTIGSGTNGEAPYPVRTMYGTQMQRLKVEIDEKTLGEIAEKTGGTYFRATDTDSLENIYEVINQLETTARKEKKFEDYDEWFAVALWPGLGLLLIEWLLRHTRYRRLP